MIQKCLDRWQNEDLYKKSFEHNKGKEKYILHDGPPYANGNIHLGHAYNKILKDILCKSRRMSGLEFPVRPGWDCHGLPIELKVTQEKKYASKVELMEACRDYANKWIETQRKEFKRLGVLMDWDNPYITMSAGYEADTLRAFAKLVEQGFIERKNKTVPWCYHDQTVLASAEIEYQDRKDPSIYAPFKLDSENSKKIFPEIKGDVSLVIWTTTPWTLPLNRGVMIHNKEPYSLVEINGSYYILGAKVAEKVGNLIGSYGSIHPSSPSATPDTRHERENNSSQKTNPFAPSVSEGNVSRGIKIIETFSPLKLEGAKLQHPFIDNLIVPIILDESVGTDEGTACVHVAPGCGPIDYEIGVKNGLEIFSPISADGKYAEGIQPKELENMAVMDGQIWVIKKLAEVGKLLYKSSITHSYPHCWRCHNGLIFRATKQWFFDLDKHDIKGLALDSISKMNFIPSGGRNFLKATVSSRWEWCLSRQRIWGVPIPALLCNSCDYAFINSKFIEAVAVQFEKQGIEYWQKAPIEELIKDAKCPTCNKSDFRKEFDILDVWFDAGVSHYAVLYKDPALRFPADIYLEGVDQHRGWFQSSLITSLVLEKQACTKTIMTHGYTVDEKGRKMSKSLGNVVQPMDVIDKIGTDGLRLWVASIGYDSDPVASETLIKNVSEVFRKIRNTSRFLLSNLYDFDIKKDGLDVDQLLEIDRYALVKLYNIQNNILAYYGACDFTGVFHTLADYCSSELSSFYLDIIKDRLYVEASNGVLRRSAQTAIWHILDSLTKLIAPILSFTAESISDSYQKDKKDSIHLQNFSNLEYVKKAVAFEFNESVEIDVPTGIHAHIEDTSMAVLHESAVQEWEQQWDALKNLRDIILKEIEGLRAQSIVGHSLDIQVTLFVDLKHENYKVLEDFFKKLTLQHEALQQFFKEFLIISQFHFAKDNDDLPLISDGVYARVAKAVGSKCPRCWQWDAQPQEDGLCRRCTNVLKK